MSETETETQTPPAADEELEPRAETGADDELDDDELDEAHVPTEPEPDAEELARLEAEAADLADMQRMMKALDRAQSTYRKKVIEVMGLEEEPPECSHCAGTGFDLKGEGKPPELQHHEQYRQCEECAGAGYVDTGSLRPELAAIECPGCSGRGYKERLTPAGVVSEGEPQYGTPPWMGNVAEAAA